LEFYNNFYWAVPTSYAKSLADCWFEEGDTFYDTQEAYSKWEIALKHLTHEIMITSPSGSSNIALSKEAWEEYKSYRRFKNNWKTKVSFILTNYKTKKSENINTTQGRLYTFLWQNNIEILNSDNQEPKTPWLVTEVTKEIKQHMNILIVAFRRERVTHHIFITVYDPTNEVSTKRYLDLNKHLNTEYESKQKLYSPKELMLPNHDSYAPTIFIAKYLIKNSYSKKDILATLKNILCKSSKDEKPESEKVVIKKIERHGIFLSSE